MAAILLIGTDESLLEGLAQSLSAMGHRACIVPGFMEGAELAVLEPPLVVVVERSLAMAEPSVAHLGLARGGAVLLYHTPPDHAAPWVALAPSLQRAVLAELSLPLERHRLLALVQRIEARARATGAGRHDTPPEHRAL
ncbi:MAG TPA: hypothetical protein VF166_08500 [Gemmatimonadaceae bacterium]